MDQLCGSLSSTLFLLRSLKPYLHFTILKSMYFALFHSKVSYGVVLWGNRPVARRALILQKKAIRIVFNLKFNEHCRPFFRQAGILTVPAMYVHCMLSLIHENKAQYRTHASVHSYNTRNCNWLIGPRHKYNMTVNNDLDISLYNRLPDKWRDSSLNVFKRLLRLYLIENPIYSAAEFTIPAASS